ncbi:LpqB family beta-propeller domain-containing protein [Spirillospora sp. NPDC047279]|uniref:LpqB family beta-propeller domain-containing protein n=1 Tax=Spirillospora sp. NPDC047279 TaxID=3155478 RepID=UPI0033EAF0DF
MNLRSPLTHRNVLRGAAGRTDATHGRTHDSHAAADSRADATHGRTHDSHAAADSRADDVRAAAGRRANGPIVRLTGCAAALLLASTACATVPSGGRVVSGRSADRAEQADDPYVRLIPVRPKAGWSPEQIVSGFLYASASFDDDHRVAREYLSGNTGWQPGARPAVTVFQDRRFAPRIDKMSETQATVKVAGDQLGAILPEGQYTADPKRVEVSFELTKTQQGAWRITGLPPEVRASLLLTKADVDRAFRTMNLYFFTPDQQQLVPNGIFLPLANRRHLATHLVRALLTGPTSWLSPAVKSAFPADTKLVGDVHIDKDIATVNLSGQARAGDPERMSAQLSWTLRQLSDIKQWRLRIDGEEIAPEGHDETQPIRSWQEYNPDGQLSEEKESTETPYFIGSKGQFSGLLSGKENPLWTGLAYRLARPAASPDKLEVAGLSPEGDKVLYSDKLPSATNLQTLLTSQQPGSRFTPPTWDRNNQLWVVETARDESWLWVRKRGQRFQRVEHWGLGGREVLSLRVARDGVRAAAIVKVDGRTQIQIGRIAYDPSGAIDAGAFLPVSSELVDAKDLAWRSFGTLAVLGRKGGDSQALPYLVPVSGSAITPLGIGALGEPESIAASPGAPVYIGTRSGDRSQICQQQAPRDQYSEWSCRINGSDPNYAR